jgi:hypothetical protein
MRRTWLVGDGPCKFLADRDRRHQRHHLMLYGSDAPTDTPSAARQHRRHADISVRDMSQPVKSRNEAHGTSNMYLASTGFKKQRNCCDKITAAEQDLQATQSRRVVPGKIGSAHWRAPGVEREYADGSWDVTIYNPDAWESHRINPIEYEVSQPRFTPPPRSPQTASDKSVASPDRASPVRMGELASLGR